MLTRPRRWSRAAINKLSSQDRLLTVGTGTTINPLDVVRDLGVLFDSELTMKKHIAKVAAVCFFNIRWLRQIRRRVGKDVTIRLMLALITPRLDYCNSVFVGLPQSTLESLQSAERRCSACVWLLTSSWSCLAIPDATTLSCTIVCYRQVAAGHERCSASCERHEEVRPRLDTPVSLWAALARCGRWSHIQAWGDGVQVLAWPGTGLSVWAVHTGRSSCWTTASSFRQPPSTRCSTVSARYVRPSHLRCRWTNDMELVPKQFA